jgi:hypothetical protein
MMASTGLTVVQAYCSLLYASVKLVPILSQLCYPRGLFRFGPVVFG